MHSSEEELTVLSLSESSGETVDDSGGTGEIETTYKERERGNQGGEEEGERE